MEPRIYETQRMHPAIAILDLEDRMLREQQGGASHPRPFGRLTVALIAQILADGTRQPIDPALELILKRSLSGYLVFFGQIQLPGGLKRRVQLAVGRYVARVESDYYLTAYRDDLVLPQPATAYFFDLEANEFHPLNR